MAGYEQTIIVGHVGRSPEMKYLQNGTAVTNFSVAVSSAWTDTSTGERREKTNWYKCAAWGKQAEIANQYIKKGTQVQVVGTVEARAYTGNDGEPKASLELRVNQFILLGNRGETSNEDSQYDEASGKTIDEDIPF